VLEVCGTWEGCLWEGLRGCGRGGTGGGGPVASVLPPQLAALLGGASEDDAARGGDGSSGEDSGDEDGGLDGGGAGGDATNGGAFGPGWLQRELAAAAAWQRVLRDGRAMLTLPCELEAWPMPRELARALGEPAWRRGSSGAPARRAGGAGGARARWRAAAEVCVLYGLHRALTAGATTPEPPEEDAPLAGLRWGTRL
jgi:hypothetical protein